ncbi:MAG: ParB/RepB/Spo0J family partition protein [Nitrospirota bacterium]|nr:ParB/RepB/Spo0J family partition protein [Nitrospirota bacterium]
MSRTALGKGIGALIPDLTPDQQAAGVQVVELDVKKITPNDYQPRKVFKEEELKDLSESIKSLGVIQPVIVRRLDEDRYQLIAGERRWRAVKLAGIKKIPAVVRKASNEEMLEMALIENIQREELNPIETAEAYRLLMNEFKLTQEEVSAKVGKERATVANYLRLLGLPMEIRDDISEGRLSTGHAKALLALPSEMDQLALRSSVIQNGLSVRQTEALASKIKKAPAKAKSKVFAKDPYVISLEDRLQKHFGTKVIIDAGKKGGHIRIDYFTNDDLERILELLNA